MFVNVDGYGRLNITIPKGRDYSLELTLSSMDDGSPYDITSVTISSYIRKYEDLAGDRVAEFIIDKTSPTLGIFNLTLTAEVTEEIEADNGYFDILAVVNGKRKNWVRGKALFTGSVTEIG